MKLKTTLLATAIAAATLSAGANAATLPAKTTRTIDGSDISSAVFAGGATINGGANFMAEIPADQAVGYMATLNPASVDVGREGDLYTVILENGNKWYMKTATGYSGWSGKVSELQPFSTETLTSTVTFSETDLEAATGATFDGDSIRVFVGFMSDITDLTYSSSINVDVATAATACPTGTTPSGSTLCVLSGTYSSDLHLTANKDYVISGAVFIGGDNTTPAELTIDAGVTTFGESGSDFIVINRGSKIHANGSASAPIIMTSANDATATSETRGQWGGLIINGNATINGCTEGTAVCEAEGEGSTGLYGGTDDADSSGNLNYLVVKYAGFEITPDNELNGIAFQAVGSGTVVDYVQVHNNSDDGVEFFGGTVNAKHLYLSGNADDSVDWTLGWRGKLQHVAVLQTDRGDQGIEADSNSSNRDSLPRAKPVISNITLIGNENTDLGMLLREGTGANISNAVVAGFADACIDIDHSETFAAAGTLTELSGSLTMTNSVVDCTTNFDIEVEDGFDVGLWFTGQAGNSAISTGMTGVINSSAVNAITPFTQTDSWFDQTTYIGGVTSAEADWTAGWTYKD